MCVAAAGATGAAGVLLQSLEGATWPLERCQQFESGVTLYPFTVVVEKKLLSVFFRSQQIQIQTNSSSFFLFFQTQPRRSGKAFSSVKKKTHTHTAPRLFHPECLFRCQQPEPLKQCRHD